MGQFPRQTLVCEHAFGDVLHYTKHSPDKQFFVISFKMLQSVKSSNQNIVEIAIKQEVIGNTSAISQNVLIAETNLIFAARTCADAVVLRLPPPPVFRFQNIRSFGSRYLVYSVIPKPE